MNTHLARHLALLTIATLILTGCVSVISVGNRSKKPRHPHHPDVIYVEDADVITEIDAADSLDFSSDKTRHLARIASRPDLGPEVQVYLVDYVLEELDFESEKRNVLIILIKNPAFCASAKTRILQRLDDLDFSSTRKQILHALDERGPVSDPPVEEVREYEVRIELPDDHHNAAPETPETPETPDTSDTP